MHTDKFKNIFLRIVSSYVKKYEEHSFEIYLDKEKYLIMGKSQDIIKVRIMNSNQVLKRIFVE